MKLMRKYRFLAARRILLVGFAAAVFAVSSFAKTVTITLTDNNTSICLIEGDTLIVNLPSTMPGVYRWDLVESIKPSPLSSERQFSQGERQFSQSNSAKQSKTQSFRLNAAAPGKTMLLLAYNPHAVMDAPREVSQTLAVDVTVASGQPESMVLIGTYEGTTACADCTGIQTRLRLYAKGANDFTEAIFVSTRSYLGGKPGNQSFTERGEWSLLRGDATDPNATVYALNPDRPEDEQYMLRQAGGAELTLLDRNLKPVDAPAIYRLTLKKVD
jgi:copper homeostasis protein (lipoprotein)